MSSIHYYIWRHMKSLVSLVPSWAHNFIKTWTQTSNMIHLIHKTRLAIFVSMIYFSITSEPKLTGHFTLHEIFLHIMHLLLQFWEHIFFQNLCDFELLQREQMHRFVSPLTLWSVLGLSQLTEFTFDCVRKSHNPAHATEVLLISLGCCICRIWLPLTADITVETSVWALIF